MSKPKPPNHIEQIDEETTNDYILIRPTASLHSRSNSFRNNAEAISHFAGSTENTHNTADEHKLRKNEQLAHHLHHYNQHHLSHHHQQLHQQHEDQLQSDNQEDDDSLLIKMKEEMKEEMEEEMEEEMDQLYVPHRITSKRESRDFLYSLENRKNGSVCSMLFSNHNRHQPHNLSDLVYKPIVGRLSNSLLEGHIPGLDAANNNDYQKVTLNIGGVRYETYKKTLKVIQESRLANLTETNSDFDPILNEYFFDRDPNSFLAILNYYRTGKLHAPVDVCGNLFYEEMNFWGIGEQSIQPCCWTKYSAMRDCDEILKKVMDSIDDDEQEDVEYPEDCSIEEQVPTYTHKHNKTKDSIVRMPRTNNRHWLYRFFNRYYSRYRPMVWKFFDDRTSSIGAGIFFWISVIILAVSIISFVLATHSFFRVPFDISTNKTLSRKEREALTSPHASLNQIELFCNLFFSCEFILRFLSSPRKLTFLRNPYNIFEFVAILPILLPAETAANKHTWTAKLHGYIEVFYILRILRIFTLVPKYSGLRVLLLTLKTSLGELVLYVLMLLMTIMIFASFVFYAEQIFELEDNKFDSILISLWWAIVTMTTLGYGDIVPGTPLGYIVGALCALCGLIFLALPVPVIVNNFATFYAHAKARQKLKESTEFKDLPNQVIGQHMQNSLISGQWFHSKISMHSEHCIDQSENDTEENNYNVLSQLSRSAQLQRNFSSKHVMFKLVQQRTSRSSSLHSNSNKLKCWSKLRKEPTSNQYSTLLQWKNCKRRTIRRSAIIDHRLENRLIDQPVISLNDHFHSRSLLKNFSSPQLVLEN